MHADKKVNLNIAAGSNYHKDIFSEIPAKIFKQVLKHSDTMLFTVSQAMEDYHHGYDESDSDVDNDADDILEASSSSEADNTPKSETVDPASFNRYFKKYVGKDVTISGTVLKIEKDDDTGHIITLTDGNYDNAVAIGVSVDVMETLGDVTLQEGDTITVDGAAVPGYSSTSIGGSEKDIPGIEATDLKITSNY